MKSNRESRLRSRFEKAHLAAELGRVPINPPYRRMSALPPETDIGGALGHVGLGPIPDIRGQPSLRTTMVRRSVLE
jgi:hypothetical protein